MDWIYDLKTSRSLRCPTNGIRVSVGGVELRSHGGVSGFIKIKLLPRPTNLPLESHSLRISCF